MHVGLIGAGNMARALARGWGDPVLVSDSGSGRARELVEELGGDAVESNVEVADRADLVVLAHKPAQFEKVAGELRGHAKAVASVVGGVSSQALRDAYGVPVFRFTPNTPVEVRRGVVCYSPEPRVDARLEADVLELFGRLGSVVKVPALAGRLVAETMAGTAALLQTREYDTLAVRRAVTSPGGTTARGLAALERGGVRPAFQEAFDAVVGCAR
jgi:pyrroline-5-carboxylate reductase